MTRQNLADVKRIVLHHSASPRETTTLAMVRKWHMDRGFLDVGYHYVIEGKGELRYGRPIDCIPAAQKGANTGTIAVCVVGDNTRDGEGWTEAQKLSVASIVAMLRHVLGRPLELVGHRDVAASECPGVEVSEVFPHLV
jgi:N-acetylmuramoyl-L-alanine amidase